MYDLHRRHASLHPPTAMTLNERFCRLVFYTTPFCSGFGLSESQACLFSVLWQHPVVSKSRMNGRLHFFSAGCKQWRVNSCITVLSAATLLLFLTDLGVFFPFVIWKADVPMQPMEKEIGI